MRASLLASAALLAVCGAGQAAVAADAPRFFVRVATVPVFETLPAGLDPAQKTAAEILAATADGLTAVFTDSPGTSLGVIDLTDPAQPGSRGRVALGGEPTSVSVVGGYALVGVNTSESYTHPSGHIAVVSLKDLAIQARCDVGGQPDSLAVDPKNRFLAVAVENERDEETNNGALPQLPPGHLALFDLGPDGTPTNCQAMRKVDVTGLATIAPEDPEPEFVDLNAEGRVILSLQENNHLVIVDAATGKIVNHFSAGTVSLDTIDTRKDGIIQGTGSLKDIAREPDAVAWLDAHRFVSANEGDYKGGSRGFTVWTDDGTVAYDSGPLMEHLAMRIGHFPEKRAGKKGSEPEGAEMGVFDGERLFFINAERANMVAVFRDMGPGQAPAFVQVLPTGVGPEGVLALPERGLLLVAAEEDSAKDNVRASVSVYARTATRPAYPTLESADDPKTGAPIGWGALSGLAADPKDPARLYTLSDSAYASARIYTLDASQTPARLSGFVEVTGAPQEKLDLEGIATRPNGGFWVVSEGNPDKGLANLLLAVGADGTVERTVTLPDEVARQAGRFGFEGVAVYGDKDHEKVAVAFQRPWQDDPKDQARIGLFDPQADTWTWVRYPLSAPTSPAGGWVGLSEIVSLGDQRFAVIERDNQPGPAAALKQIAVFDLAGVTPAATGADIPVVGKTVVKDLLPVLKATNGWTLDKVEGLCVAANGGVYMLTDNDGVDDATGETLFARLGSRDELFK
ncbi:esterase-like activity of phytase family protein [Pararhodospirillum oryzae]|uniref:Alkaline phosphatase n=1 Tax=Pararhodospirillum oryzae TaxID=478448 RepID=A0A512H767_9PROT|nr:esterase-like activity of phytase family protein [Pararhodospirillum oryzae]GEO81299.1 alkaline phosphatase [Pararhodospirillum oryzae]